MSGMRRMAGRRATVGRECRSHARDRFPRAARPCSAAPLIRRSKIRRKNHGTKKIARKVAAIMPPMTPVPTDCACSGTRAGRDREWQHAEDERERGHQDRPEPQTRGLDRRGRGGQALPRASAQREFDDQDRVLRREPEQRDEADLEIDVVGHPAEVDARECAKRSERERQQHRERQRPSLVLRGQDQEHHDHRQHEREVPRRRPSASPGRTCRPSRS